MNDSVCFCGHPMSKHDKPDGRCSGNEYVISAFGIHEFPCSCYEFEVKR